MREILWSRSVNLRRFRVAHTGVSLPYELTVDDHALTVVATDGYDIKPLKVDIVLVHPGETVDFEITANQTSGKYWVRATTTMAGRKGGKLEINQVGS